MSNTPATDWYQDDADEGCSFCGGETYVHECFDGCCENAEDGCDDCMRPCPECNQSPGMAADLRQALADALAEPEALPTPKDGAASDAEPRRD